MYMYEVNLWESAASFLTINIPKEMAARNTRKSAFLADDRSIFDLAETIDAPRNYKVLGLDLVESKAELSSVIGETSTDYADVVFNCLIDWRNANGVGDGQCRELIMILKECELTNVASWLHEKQGEKAKCLSIDGVLQEISAMIDCPKYHQKLCLKLVDGVKLSNMIGNNRPPPYKDALFQCFIKFRDREGSSMESARKLRKILTNRKLNLSVAMLDGLEPGIGNTDGNADCGEDMETGEPEAGLHCQDRITPEGSS